MDHMLIFTIISGIVAAFLFGTLAVKLKLPEIFGYILAGILIGPYTPGFVADTAVAKQLAEIGVILLMFGVGLHFSFRDLRRVRQIALPGAVVQMAAATFLGALAALVMGYTWSQGLIFGLALSVASTVVLIRALQQNNLTDTPGGKIALGWLIVEDIAMVLVLVALPSLTGLLTGSQTGDMSTILYDLIEISLKISGFVFLMVGIGRYVIPFLLKLILGLQSSELETLCSLAIALGFAALAYVVFDASFALGAFLAGMMLNASKQGESFSGKMIPLQHTFSALFFVSVGMLFNPTVLIQNPTGVLLTIVVIVVVKCLSALAILHIFQQNRATRVTVALGLSQIGEFSFILGGAALTMGLITQDLFNLLLAGALFSIIANPLLFKAFKRIHMLD